MGEITTMDMLSPPRQCRDSDSWHILNESPPVTPVKRWNDDGDGPDSAQRSPLRPLKGPKIASTEPVKQLQENEMASGSIWALARRDRDPLLSTTKQKPVR